MFCLALAGRWAKKTRQVFPDRLKGLNLVVTSVMCFVIIIDSWSLNQRVGKRAIIAQRTEEEIEQTKLGVSGIGSLPGEAASPR